MSAQFVALRARLSPLALAAIVMTSPGCAGDATPIVRTIALPPTPAGYQFREPNIAATASYPDVVVVTAAAYQPGRGAVDVGITPWHFTPVWTSSDGARTWTDGRDPLASALPDG